MRIPRFRMALVAGLIATFAFAGSASAIVQGVPDDHEHPQVGQLFFFDPTYPDPRFDEPGGWFNCTGTLISSRVVLTAGHCTFGTGLNGEPTAAGVGGNDVWVNFSEDIRPFYDTLPPSLSFDRDQDARYDAWTALLNDPDSGWVRGESWSHPDYDDGAFYVHDAGVVILDQPIEIGDEVEPGVEASTVLEYGELPTLDYLDRYDDSKLRREARFQPVGYGIEVSRGYGQIGGDHRLKATSKLVNLNGALGIKDQIAVSFSNNNGKGKTGGTCNGDSGGPIFDLQDPGDNLIVAVTSFGVSNACRGIDGAYRIDQPDDLEWLVPIQEANDYDGEAHEG